MDAKKPQAITCGIARGRYRQQKMLPNQSPIIDKNKPSLVDAWYAYGNFVQLYAQKWAD
ncbi:hypothetical protein [Brevibacillus parabrevis]|uniref:hypothetical protein n=1 Tax=Brevibacillus parabrevis TaxID=54914 RepID=UPI0012F50247|nr:hypothetical protein [Brevibacillus parabrevis]